jgi:hypothetical protein
MQYGMQRRLALGLIRLQVTASSLQQVLESFKIKLHVATFTPSLAPVLPVANLTPAPAIQL